MSNFAQFFGSAAGTGFPIGAAVDVFGSGYDDANWLKANGRVVTQAAYPALYESIGIIASKVATNLVSSVAAPSGTAGWSTGGGYSVAAVARDSGGVSVGIMSGVATGGIVGLSSTDGVVWTTMQANWPQYTPGESRSGWAIGGYRKGVFGGREHPQSSASTFTQYVVWNGTSTTLYSMPPGAYARDYGANSNYYYIYTSIPSIPRAAIYRGVYGSDIAPDPIWQSGEGVTSWSVVGNYVYITAGSTTYVSTNNGDSFSTLASTGAYISPSYGFDAGIARKGMSAVILVSNGSTTSEVNFPGGYSPDSAGLYEAYVEAGNLFFYSRILTDALWYKPVSNLATVWAQVPFPAGSSFLQGGSYANGAAHLQLDNFWFSKAGRVLHVPEYLGTEASPKVLRSAPFSLFSFAGRHFALGTSQAGANATLELLALTPPYDDATQFQIPNAVSADPLKTTMIRAR